VLHPRKSVIDMEFAKLESEVARVFSTVTSLLSKKNNKQSDNKQHDGARS
jgi:hypothetical protein